MLYKIMRLLEFTNQFDLVANSYIAQPYRIFKAMSSKYRFLLIWLLESSHDSFAIDWFALGGRRGIVNC